MKFIKLIVLVLFVTTLVNCGAYQYTTATKESNEATTEQQEQVKQESHKEAPKLNSENTKIDFFQDSEKVHNLIKGLSPYPGAYTFLKKEDDLLKVKIFKSSFSKEIISKKVGVSINNGKDELLISCGQGHLKVLELQIQGKKRMKIKDLLNGFRINNEAEFG